MWDVGDLARAFWKLFHLLDPLDAQWLSDGSRRRLEGLKRKFLTMGGEETILPRVSLHLEVGVKFGPTWDASHLWQWMTFVGRCHLCHVLLDVSQVPVVHLSRGGLTNRFCIFGKYRPEVLLKTC